MRARIGPIQLKPESQVAVATVNAVRPPVRTLREISVGRVARKTGVAIIGSTIVASGVALIVLPGPGSLVIPLGLMILATEFSWAAKLLRQLGTRAHRLKVAIGQRLAKRSKIAGARTLV